MIAVAVAAGGPVSGPSAQRAARAELAHDRYRQAGPSLLSRFVDWLGRELGRLTSGGGSGAGGASHALLLLLVVAVVVAVALAIRAGVPGRRRRSTADSAGAIDPLLPVDAAAHRRRAEELTRAGRRDEALREWLRAAIATIEERGVLPPQPGRTGAATAREAAPLLPAAAADLGTATRAFDEVWFGARAATDGDVAAAHRAADATRSGRITATPTDGGTLAVPS